MGVEKKERKYGENVALDIDLARHGKKGSFNSSRIENVEETSQIAQDEDLSGYDVVAVRTTPVERAVHTALTMKEGFEINDTLQQGGVNVRARELPTGILSEDGVNIKEIMRESKTTKDVNLISPNIREQYKQAVLGSEGSTWQKENAGVEVFIGIMQSNLKELGRALDDLSQSNNLSEEAMRETERFKVKQKAENGMSMLEVVLRMVKNIGNYTEVTNRLKSGTKAFIHEVNHSGFIEPFLIYLLDEQVRENPIAADGKSDLEKLGGGFEPNESVRISIKREEKDGLVKLHFKFRGKEYEIDDKKLMQSKALLDLIKSHE